jgi:hypothetical protein
LGELAEEAGAQNRLDLCIRVYEAIRQNQALPTQNRLTATYDLARTLHNHGRSFDALELLQEVLRQTDGTGMCQARKTGQIGVTIESAAFELMKKIRLFADTEVDFCNCCGEAPQLPLPKPGNLEEMNRLFDELWKDVKGGVGGDNRPITRQLLERKDEILPAILYNLQQRRDAHRMLVYCGFLGTNAAVALPFITRYVCAGDSFPFTVYGSALAALAGIGKPAACATPILILATEGSEYAFNVAAALEKVGTPPKRVIPYLARLLYHRSASVCEKAAKAIVETANLDKNQFAGKSGDQVILSVRNWWEEEGIKKEWRD